MSEAGSPVGAKQLRMQSLARSGQAEATLESEAGALVTSIMQSLTYRVSSKTVPTWFFALLSASTHANCKSSDVFEKFRKFAPEV